MRRTSFAGHRFMFALVAVGLVVAAGHAEDQAVRVRYVEGSQRGFVVLKSQAGAILASGEVTQIPHGGNIEARLVLHFRDGSVNDETTVYSQKSTFRLISYRLLQKGKSFPDGCQMMIDMGSQQVTTGGLSGEGAKTEHRELPPDLSNGMLFNMIKNLHTNGPVARLPYLAADSKPRMVTLAISLEKEVHFTIAGRPVKAAEWDVKAQLGGIVGLVAPLIGKQPADTHVWIAEGKVPTIVRVDAPLYPGGPVWSIQLASPEW